MMTSTLRAMRGYTLLELMVVLGMVGILAGIAIPSFAQQIKQNRLTTNANQLHSTFKFARSEGAKRDVTIDLVVADDKWLVQLSDGEVLNKFEPTHSSISIVLDDMQITSTGSTATSKEFLVTDNDTSTNDYRLCIYLSGQSKLMKEGACP